MLRRIFLLILLLLIFLKKVGRKLGSYTLYITASHFAKHHFICECEHFVMGNFLYCIFSLRICFFLRNNTNVVTLSVFKTVEPFEVGMRYGRQIESILKQDEEIKMAQKYIKRKRIDGIRKNVNYKKFWT